MAPAPTAMHNTATAANTGCSDPGASTSPTNPVNTTSDITLGFNSATKSASDASQPIAAVSPTASEIAASDDRAPASGGVMTT